MSDDKKQKVLASVWCRGPKVPWSTLTGLERIAIVFRKNIDDERQSILENVALNFGECGVQLVELDMSDPDDIWPDLCPVCKTDMNWDIKGFWETYPQYKSEFEEDE